MPFIFEPLEDFSGHLGHLSNVQAPRRASERKVLHSDLRASDLLVFRALHLQEGLADVGPVLSPNLETAKTTVEQDDGVDGLQGRQHVEEGAVAHVPQRVNDAEHAPSHVQHTPDKQDRRTFAASDEAAEAALLLDNSEPGEVGQKVGDEDADA
eukprot:CAMPEP_0195013698 /NCGR_PEP_ID=MMETSP0326_2-20130528/14025_1 /TAXON_ID=2866 ORGANISM="Crypthecodinium cohnii, Strain Seligo" /NCGR_SAMPLE_ID=MMETSP0326_2 /ASSEMBLY_ACC=CAM_ASM_000348 /LENGTH=153 /DNA_ID=CAMNT_0040024615 /DNA_START=290 /DNA_END=752 /DNA_ORIENTATION=-